MNESELFFYINAGASYHPAKETLEEGRKRGARQYAAAEKWASENGYSFEWQHDPELYSSDWRDDCEPYAVWQCFMRDDSGDVVQSLHGIDFGQDGEPWGDNYRRVVEAELSLEEMPTKNKE